MWFVYALSAAVIWGVSYAASGRVIERGVSPIVFFTLYAAVGLLMGLSAMAVTGKLTTFPLEIRAIGKDWTWLAIAVITSGIGALLIYMAIGEKNATVASLIEISYPVFVAFFAWLFFRETQFNLMTVLGGALIIGGVAVVFLGNKG
jgi:drug/metabolite transporter (DMT)-like permease